MIVRASFFWLGFASFYLMLAGNLSEAEITASVACATASAALGAVLSGGARRRFAWAVPASVFVRPAAALVPDTLSVGRELFSAIFSRSRREGAYVRQPFEPGCDDRAATATRRAATIIAISLAPRSFVVRGETSDTIVLHALPQRNASPDHRWPL